MSARGLLISACLSGGLAVILGAFGAHGLKGKLTPEALASFEVGVRYQFIHALAIFAAVWLADRLGVRLPLTSGWFFVAGTVLFSGSIYLLSTRTLLGIESWLTSNCRSSTTCDGCWIKSCTVHLGIKA